jgi:hypothetical protein
MKLTSIRLDVIITFTKVLLHFIYSVACVRGFSHRIGLCETALKAQKHLHLTIDIYLLTNNQSF